MEEKNVFNPLNEQTNVEIKSNTKLNHSDIFSLKSNRGFFFSLDNPRIFTNSHATKVVYPEENSG